MQLEKYFTTKQIDVLKKRQIKSIPNLLFYFPTKYIDHSKKLILNDIKFGENITFIGKVLQTKINFAKKKYCSTIVDYHGTSIHLYFFRSIFYFKNLLRVNQLYAFSGKLDKFRGKLSIIHPEIEPITKEELIHTNKIIPIYKLTDSMNSVYLSNRKLREVIFKVLKEYKGSIKDHLTDKQISTHNLLPLPKTIKLIHFPDNMNDISQAQNRLAFDELLVFFSFLKKKKSLLQTITREYYLKEIQHTFPEIIINDLPFELTNDQKNAIKLIKKKLYKISPSAILLQGDVGSGKTLVAVLTALLYIEQGMQVAFLAPTEVLVRQHYQNIINFLSVLPLMQVEFLLGKEKSKEKIIKLDRIKQGTTQLIIGTHAIFQKDVHFAKLAFVIIDEQHRFGVEQRAKLLQKGNYPDLLAMTATPIPRSLSLTLFGDFETITIKEKPADRLPIETKIFPERDIEKIYQGIKKYVDQGRQAYIIYPLIGNLEESNQNESSTTSTTLSETPAQINLFELENLQEQNSSNWKSILSDFDHLSNVVFKDYTVGILHGKLASQDKERAMQQYKSNDIQILISTTVIEVGVDVPNANVIVIRNAERFGLSQLHQLRGRVGRGKYQSFCILIYSDTINIESKQRLEIMTESNDGFYLAQKDLELRGSGEMLGLKQAGSSEFKIADIRCHRYLVPKAKELLDSSDTLYNFIIEKKNWDKKLNQKSFLLYSS